MNQRSSEAARPEHGRAAESRTSVRGKAGADIAFNLALLGLSIFLFAQAGNLPPARFGVLGPGVFPRMVLIVLMCFNVVILALQTRRYLASQPLRSGFFQTWVWRNRLMLGTLALFILYVITVPLLGYSWASFGFILAAEILLGFRRGWRRLVIAIVVALAFSFGIDLLFQDVFSIFLPAGVIG
jgi:putative tricarboxylic transport membrane protein